MKQMKTMPKRHDAIYARQSIDKIDSLSIETQIEKAQRISDGNNQVYADRGFSGKNTNRPALQQLKTDIECGTVARVIVYRLDRISRNIADFYQFYRLMEQHQVQFISINENFDTSSPMGRAMMGILIVFAQMERESIQERVTDNYYKRIATDGRWPGGPAPYGFTNGKTADNKPTLIPTEEMQLVKRAFELYVDDLKSSLGSVAHRLYNEGFRSRRKNSGFDNVTIARILQNPVYAQADILLYRYYISRQAKIIGTETQWDGTTSAHVIGKRVGNVNTRSYTDLSEQTVYRTNFAGVIPSELFLAAQDRLARNQQLGWTNRPHKMQELSGLVKCKRCGYAVKTNNYPTLSCWGRSTLHCCDVSFRIPFPELQKNAAEEIQTKLHTLAENMKRKMEKQLRLDEMIQRLDEEITRLVDLAALAESDITQISQAIEQRKKKIAQIELNRERNIPTVRQQKLWKNIPDFNKLSLLQRTYITQLLIERIELEENGDMTIRWKI